MKRFKVMMIGVLALVLIVAGTATALAGSGPQVSAASPLSESEVDAVAGEFEGLELIPVPGEDCRVSIDGGFRGVWGADDAPGVEPPGVVAGVYGTVTRPDGTTRTFFSGIWADNDGATGGYLKGRYRDGEFGGVWRCAETGVGGTLRGTYAPDPSDPSELVQHFVGRWTTDDGQQTGYLKGTWAPVETLQPEGRFGGQWTFDGNVTAAEVAPDGKLRGRYGVIKLVDGTSMHYVRGRWSSDEGVRGRLGALVVDGSFYGLWDSPSNKAGGYLKGVWAEQEFRGVWGHLGHEPEGRLWGRYGPFPTPQKLQVQTALQQQLALKAQPMPMQKVAVQAQRMPKLAVAAGK